MALVKCRECGAQVSTQAAACPKCGAPPPQPPRRTKPEVWAVAAALALIFIVAISSSSPTSQPPTREQATAQAANPQRQARLAAAGLAAGLLRMGMKDPEAFVLTSLLVMPDGTACYRYRAKNSFGAVLPGRAIRAGGKMLLEENDADAFQRAWGAECVGKSGEEIAEQVSRAIERAKSSPS